MERGDLRVKLLSRGFAWLDTGTTDSLLDACNFVSAIEKRQGLKIACPEEIAFAMGFIDHSDFVELALAHSGAYGKYLREVVNLACFPFSDPGAMKV